MQGGLRRPVGSGEDKEHQEPHARVVLERLREPCGDGDGGDQSELDRVADAPERQVAEQCHERHDEGGCV